MALNQGTIEAQIEALLTSTAGMELTEAKAEFKKQLTQIIISAIQSATITIPAQAIQVQGSASAQANLAPIPLNNVIT